MKRGFKLFLVVFVVLFLVGEFSFAAPKNNQGSNKSTTEMINMDQYVSIYANKTFSVSGSRNTTLISSKNQIDAANSTGTWEYQDTNEKEVYSYIHNEQGTFMTGVEIYTFDPNINDYYLKRTQTFSPPFKYFPIGETLPYQTWGGIYTLTTEHLIHQTIDEKNEWREYRFCGYEDVTVPYGTFKDALKIRRLRLDGGLSNYWYVPEIGRVKSENIWRSTGYMEIHELVSASY